MALTVLIIDPDAARRAAIRAPVEHPEVRVVEAGDLGNASRMAMLERPQLVFAHASSGPGNVAFLLGGKAALVLTDERYGGEEGAIRGQGEAAAVGATAYLALPPDPHKVRRGAAAFLGIDYADRPIPVLELPEPFVLDPIVELEVLYTMLDRLTYYQVLGVKPTASADAIREAFHSRALGWHPDRYQACGDEGLRGRIYSVYKRVAEGYRVLADPELRAAYDAAVKRGQYRYLRVERELERRPEDAIENPSAKRFYVLALSALETGDRKSALMNLRLAAQLEPQNPLLVEKLREVETEG